MQSALAHRGPDDEGLWLGPAAALAHRRLAILDLSGAARQPMTTPDGRFTICFNGEIYNFRNLRADLEQAGETFRTQSDTEVILRLFQRYGPNSTRLLRGMFAFAIWDAQEGSAYLARDALGIKPLYFHERDGTLAFASELRALCQSGLFTPTTSHAAVQRYFETGSVPEPLTLANEARMLEAGMSLTWAGGKATRQTWWQLRFGRDFTGNAAGLTRDALLDSVRHHFISDVPVGIFLSGGIDSTAVLALANECGHRGVDTFCIAVDHAAADESAVARRTADHFGAHHHELRLDATRAQELFDDFLSHLDQPSIDGLNTFTVSSLAREHGMKVVLSGLGGDELFGGYSSFTKIPQMLRWHRLLHHLPGVTALLDRGKPWHRRLADFARSPGTVPDAFSALRGIFSKTEAVALTAWITGTSTSCIQQPTSRIPSPESRSPASTIPDQISELEITRYMRNQLLRDSDVMSMAHGLELRVPFVDRALFEAIAVIPASQRLQSGKQLLVEAVPELPEWVISQKKRGFLFPYEQWLESNWGHAFTEVARGAPIRMPRWYQLWSVFVLSRCLRKLNLPRHRDAN